MTIITTTAKLRTEQERIAHLKKFPAYLLEDTVKLVGSFGTEYYTTMHGKWVSLEKLNLQK